MQADEERRKSGKPDKYEKPALHKDFVPYEYIISGFVMLVLCNSVVLGGLYYSLFSGGKYKKVEKTFEFHGRFKRMNDGESIIKTSMSARMVEEAEKLGYENINSPSVIRAPSWIKKPLGKYYMYFSHHKGNYIRMAFANKPEGPWTIC